MSLRTKLVLGVCFVSLGGLLAIGYGFWGSRRIRHVVTRTLDKTYPSLEQANKLQTLIGQTRETIMSAIELEDASLLDEIGAAEKAFATVVNEIIEHGPEAELEAIYTSYRTYTANARRIVNLFISDGMAAVQEDIPLVGQEAAALLASIGEFRTNKEEALMDDLNGISHEATTFLRVFLIYALCFAGAMVLALLLGSRTTHLIGKITRVAQDIAGGNLDKAHSSVSALSDRVRGGSAKDETVQLVGAIATMTQNLNSLISAVQASGIHITGSASGVAASAKDLEAMATEQAVATREVSSTANLIADTSQNLVTTMDALSRTAAQAGTQADGGRSAIEKMRTTMQSLIAQNDVVTSRLSMISEKTNEINVITTTITKLADQTNLLSLNASIEAVKAGEHGLGFTVVAREIRRLADQTAIAVLEIEKTIQDMVVTVSACLEEIKRFTSDVKVVGDEMGNVSTPLEKIIGQIEELIPSFESVNDGVQAQAQRARHISESMSQLDSAAQHTSDSLRSFGGGTVILNEAAERLEREVTRFNVGASPEKRRAADV